MRRLSGNRPRPRPFPSWLPWAAFLAIAVVVPATGLLSEGWILMLFFVALYVVLGLGLNVVVGFAGLLDLGYVAFFATGAYTCAILTSPASPIDAELNFWVVLPIGVFFAMIVGVLLGLPVLPLRGDYLAIVTLGFGEIIRIFLVNRTDLTKGSQGISAISLPPLPGAGWDINILGWRLGWDSEVDSFRAWYYFAVILAIVVAFVTTRLRDSRVGRAWEAIREDEDVAASMGINTTKYKLMAFGTGAAIGGLGGVIYASHIAFINPAAFSLQVSIDVLAIVIIGGMGSIWGVIAGSFVLIGIPRILLFKETSDFLAKFEWLRDGINGVLSGLDSITPGSIGALPPADRWGAELGDDTRFIIFGALLVAIMVLRPSGIFPSRRRELEFENPPEAERSPAEAVSA